MMEFRSWINLVAICVVLMQICGSVESQPMEDRISSFPGQPEVSFEQYGGYATVDDSENRSLFYYFVEADSDPASKPLVLWLNGGPGCSSIGAGAFSEHGPFKPKGDGTLLANEFSWNKEANIIYLESPAGVGFSYSANVSFYNSVNDTITARDNLEFLRRWLVKFPEYKNRDFFITGESYAGHYVPQLAQLVASSELKSNFKGIAIGNPLLQFETDFNAEDEFYHSHGLISDSTYEFLSVTCNTSQMWRESIAGFTSEACKQVQKKLEEEIPSILDSYDVTADSCVSNGRSKSKNQTQHRLRTLFPFALSAPLKQAPSQQAASQDPDLCIQEKTDKYLNRKDVQNVFHARLVGVTEWSFCSSVIHYDQANLEIPTIGVVGSLAQSGIRVLVFSGDQDSVIPFIGTRRLVNDLAKQMGLNATAPYRAWFENKQVGGWTQSYGNYLSYATIRGASHMAPYSSPRRSLALFAAFIGGKPLPETP